ncbi:hypothetical protein TNCV_2117991 [Trichonephila clavipes]|nr:hypothetical protein TNCV_2117991 [Trichonephila clavipes]
MRCFPGIFSCGKYRIQASSIPASGINEDLFACVWSAVFPDFQVSSARIPECSCVVLYNFEVKWTNVFPPSEVRGRGTEKNNICKIEEGKEFNVYRSSDCEVKVKAGFCEGRVDAVAMGAQRVINPDNIGVPLLN